MLVVLVAAVVACPLSYIMMTGWLNNYASRIDITAIPFVLCVLVIAVATLLLIGLQTAKTAVSNPVKSLRTE